MFNGLLVEQVKSAMSGVPINTTGAALTTVWISLKAGRRVRFSILQGAWAAGTPAVTLLQATDNAAAGSKALNFGHAFYYQSTTTSPGLTTRAAISSNTFNLPNQANTLTQIEVAAEDLDMNNSFAYVALQIASPGANADLLAVLADVYQLDQSATPASLPSILA